MQVVQLSASGAPDAMKSDEGNDSLDTFIRHAIGKESLLSFSRTGDSPVQWIQLLNSSDQPDLLGWPLFTPMRIQLRQCEKCSMEFCSPINYRRHIRMHRRRSRSLIVDKESHKNRDLLGAFWDNLSVEDAKKVVSFDDIWLKEVSGSSVVKALGSALRKPGVWTMPQAHVKAGALLLDVSPRLPISSEELFIILDDASERTFLCAGTAESVQKFIIDGEAEESLELRNLIASASLLFEQKLVRAWLADKDAEALRCQKLLMEEEEAAEKRRSQLLERRKQKQLRQQEQKAREQSNCERVDNIVDSADSCTDSVDGPSVAEISVLQVSADNDNNQYTLEDMNSFLEPAQLSKVDIVEACLDFSSDHVYDHSVRNVEYQMEMENGHPHVTINGWQVPKSRSQRSGRTGFYGSQNLQAFKFETFQKQGFLKDRSMVSGRVWTRKSKVAIDDESSEINLQTVETNNIGKNNSQLLIGSISVPVRSTRAEKCANQEASDTCSTDSASCKEDNSPEEILNSNTTQDETDQATARLISICPAERSDLPVQSGAQDSVEIVTSLKVGDNSIVSRETFAQSCPTNMNNCGKISHMERNDQPQHMRFSSDTAKAFLAQRWKLAISADHVKLVLSHEAPGGADTQLASVEASVTPIDDNTTAKFKKKPEKGTTKMKYIVKEKVVN